MNVHRSGFRQCIVLATFPLVITLIGRADAGITFPVDNGTGNTISFTNPAVVGGNTVATVVINQGPTKTPRDDGYEIVDFSYTFTSVNGVEVDATWFSSRMFDLDQAAKLTLRIFGETDITQTNGVTNLFVDGLINGFQPSGSGFISDDIKGAQNALNVPWDKSGTRDVAKGNGNTLRLNSGVVWIPNAIGDTLTVSSRYVVTIQAANIPEPSSLALGSVGLVACLGYLYRHRRTL